MEVLTSRLHSFVCKQKKKQHSCNSTLWYFGTIQGVCFKHMVSKMIYTVYNDKTLYMVYKFFLPYLFVLKTFSQMSPSTNIHITVLKRLFKDYTLNIWIGKDLPWERRLCVLAGTRCVICVILTLFLLICIQTKHLPVSNVWIGLVLYICMNFYQDWLYLLQRLAWLGCFENLHLPLQ